MIETIIGKFLVITMGILLIYFVLLEFLVSNLWGKLAWLIWFGLIALTTKIIFNPIVFI